MGRVAGRTTAWLAALLAACSLTAAAANAPAPCTTSDQSGTCGPYAYAGITGAPPELIGNNVWNPVPGWQQTLTANSPGDWSVTADMPAGNTAVVSYPSLGAAYGQVTNVPTPLAGYTTIVSSFAETMNATAGTTAWASYDIWLGDPGSSAWSHEVMIQHDRTGAAPCPAVATASFAGSSFNDVTPQAWTLCQFGSEFIWKLTGTEQSGAVHILAMLTWLERHKFLPSGTGLWLVGYGWEICSTGGVPETFTVGNFALTATRRA